MALHDILERQRDSSVLLGLLDLSLNLSFLLTTQNNLD